jgi:chromosomal replication initiation ATPase DnaA
MTNKYSSTYPAKERASFENFISIDTNTTAKATAIEFALSVTPYNVLGISSKIGNGATHLALAILKKIEANERGKEIFYSSFERLISNNSKNNELTIFNKEFLASKSLILIDSFYESSNKEISNKIVDVLKNVNTKIIFTYNEGTKVPIVQKEINISRPSVIEKKIIIKQLLKSEKMDLCLESINYIGGLSNLSVREIEGLIISIFAKRTLGDTTPDIQIVNNLLNRFINNN